MPKKVGVHCPLGPMNLGGGDRLDTGGHSPTPLMNLRSKKRQPSFFSASALAGLDLVWISILSPENSPYLLPYLTLPYLHTPSPSLDCTPPTADDGFSSAITLTLCSNLNIPIH